MPQAAAALGRRDAAGAAIRQAVIAADLAALKAGLPLPTHEDSPRGQPAPRDAYDDRLDAELDAFD